MSEKINFSSFLSPPVSTAIFAFLAIALLFWHSGWSMVEIWLRSGTYTHGILILPLSVWLIWQKRAQLTAYPSAGSGLGLVFLVLSACAWLLARLTGVQVIEQLAFVAMLIGAVWSVVGNRLAWQLGFPLFFLFLSVPVGEGLVPYLIEFTTNFIVWGLNLTGVPVFRDGIFLELPTGNWSVVDACSGSRYLIASVTLGLVYAYLAYHSLWRRIAFVILAIAMPILANGVRAYLIVMTGHLSGMELAVGVDHLIYGWVFFGLVMLLMFWLGSLWSEERQAPTQARSTPEQAPKSGFAATKALIAVLVVGFVFQGIYGFLIAREHQIEEPFVLPKQIDGWVKLDQVPWDWQPFTGGEPLKLLTAYEKNGQQAAIFVAFYPNQQQGEEAVNYNNTLVHLRGRTQWQARKGVDAQFEANKTSVSVIAARLTPTDKGPIGGDLLVWWWYQLGAHTTTTPFEAKLWEAKNRLLDARNDGAYIALSTPGKDPEKAAKVLDSFASVAYPQLRQTMDRLIGKANN